MSDRRGPVSPGRVLELGRDARELVDQLVSDALQLNAKRSTSRVTGFRRSSGFIGAHRGSGHGDPVGEAVANALEADESGPARRAYGEVSEALEAVVVILQSAGAAASCVLEPKPEGPPDVGCTSHALHGFLNVETRTPGSELCRWCADFWAKYRQRPSLADLQALEERRVYAGEKRRAA